MDLLLRRPGSGQLGGRLLDDPDGRTLHAPHLLAVEVTQVVRRFRRRGALTEGRAREALAEVPGARAAVEVW